MTTAAAPPTADVAASEPATPPTRRRHRQGRRWTVVTTAVAVLAGCYFLLPVYWLTVSATKSTGDLFGSFGLWFTDPQLISNMTNVVTFNDGIYLRWAANSLLYAGVGGVAATLVSAAAGYAFAKFTFRGREALFNVVLGGVLLPATALALPLFLLLSEVELTNTAWAVLLPSTVSPFGVYLSRIYAAASVPDELLEAARLDGAGELRIFTTLALRIMVPALVTVFLFQFVGTWNNFFLPLIMLSDTDLYPITLGLVSWQSFADRQPELYQLTVGGSLLSVVPLMVTIVVLQRFWRAGLTQGSVKG